MYFISGERREKKEKQDIYWKQLNNGKVNVTKLEPPKTHSSGYMESISNFLSLKFCMT